MTTLVPKVAADRGVTMTTLAPQVAADRGALPPRNINGDTTNQTDQSSVRSHTPFKSPSAKRHTSPQNLKNAGTKSFSFQSRHI